MFLVKKMSQYTDTVYIMFMNINGKMKVTMMLKKTTQKKIKNKNYHGDSGEEDDDDEKKTNIKRKRQTDKQAI